MEFMQKMAGAITESNSIASFATPEVRKLFDDWINMVGEEVLHFLTEKGPRSPSTIADKLKISEEGAIFFIAKMAMEKKIKISRVEKRESGK